MKLAELLDPGNIQNIYTKLQQASADFYLMDTLHTQAEIELRKWFVQAIAEGVIQGKNDNEREGNARIVRPDLYEAVDASYSGLMASRSRLEVARLEERKLSMIMRAADLYVGLYEKGEKGLEGIYPPHLQDGMDSWATPSDEENRLVPANETGLA